MNLTGIIKSREFFRLRKYRIYRNLLRDYIKPPVKMNIFQVAGIHRKGFTVSDWMIMGVNKDNYREYLSSKQYNKYHPINGYFSKLIDDKLTFKYIMSGTPYEKNTPDYYLLIDEDGVIRPMMDWDGKTGDIGDEDVLAFLRSKGKLALKLVTASLGKGFYKAEYRDGKIFVNNEEMETERFLAFLHALKNCIVSEYLTSHADFREFGPDTANTLRYLLCRIDGEYYMMKSYARFGTRKSGVVENFARGGVLCYVKENGTFNGGYVINKSPKRMEAKFVPEHPDTHKPLTGTVPCWGEIQRVAVGVAKLMPQMKYLGLDFVVTDEGAVKLLEINSLTSLDGLQTDRSILSTEVGKRFFASLKEA